MGIIMDSNLDRYLKYLYEGDRINAALYAAAKTAKTVTKPFFWAQKKATKAVYKGATKAVKGTVKWAKDKTVSSTKNKITSINKQRKLKKLLGDKYIKPKSKPGMYGAVKAGLSEPKKKSSIKHRRKILSPFELLKKVYKKKG